MNKNYEKQCPKIALALLRTQERNALQITLKKAKFARLRVEKVCINTNNTTNYFKNLCVY